MSMPQVPPPAPVPPVLSICIPTYNRAAYLDYLLGQALDTWTFSFPFEIVISDNASPDHTAEIVARYAERGLPIRYFRQTSNKGGAPNNMTALHRAVGAYIVYLADDDLLNVEGVEAGIAHLRRHPELQVLYAAWDYYDPTTGETTARFYNIPEDVTFVPGQELDLFGFLINHHIFPEHMIYRADTLRVVLLDPPFCYWAFVYLAHVAARGPVHFSTVPFYRSIGNHPAGLGRVQSGTEQAMTDWDTYRGGLEYFVYALLKRRDLMLNEESQRQVRLLIDGFIAARMRVALRLWAQRGDCISVYNLIARIHHLDPRGVAEITDRADIQRQAAIQILVRLANGIAELDRLVIVGDASFETARASLLALGMRQDIAIVPDLGTPDLAAIRGSMVFIFQDADRQKVLALGYAPGLVVSMDDLVAGLHLV